MSESEGKRHVESISALHNGRDVSHGHWSAPVTPTFATDFSFEDDHDHHHHAKKSVLAKVKEKAKKWRHMLARKKHGYDDGNLTPPWGVSLDEEEDEQDPEYHGAPMYESETAPETYRSEGTSQHQLAAQSPGTLQKSAVFQPHGADKESEMKRDSVANRALMHNMPTHQNPVGENGIDKTLTDTVTEVLAPAYTMVSEATLKMVSKIQIPGTRHELGAKQMWDKGISVREYLMNKLEPGEEDRALCQVITDAVSPRDAGEARGEGGIVEKMKEAVSSLLGKEGMHDTQIPASTNPHAHVSPASESSNPASTTYLRAHGPSSIPVSRTEEVETGGRRLQACTNREALAYTSKEPEEITA